MGTFLKSTGGYRPSGRDVWAQQQRREEHLWKQSLREEEQADQILLGLQAKVDDVLEKGRASAQRAADEISKPAAAEVKRILSQTITQYAGATHNSKPIPVWSSRLAPPTDIRLRVHGIHRTDASPLLVLRPGGGVEPKDAVWRATARKNPSYKERADYREWARAARSAIADELDRYPIIHRLRDDDAMARFFDSVGLTLNTSRKETVDSPYGAVERTVTVVNVPSLTEVEIASDGLRLTYAHRAGDSAAAWKAASKVEALKAGFKNAGVNATNLQVQETVSGDVRLVFNDRDPFADIAGIEHVYDADRGRSLLGVTSSGREAWITWNGSSGMVVGGVPGSGKTASLLPVFAAMAGKCELHVFDGKSGFDLHPLQHIARIYDRSGDIAAPLETLRALDKLRVERAEALHTAAGVNNFWNMTQEQRERFGVTPVFLILDECQTWLDQSGMSKDEKVIAEEVKRLIRTLVQKGRSAGIVVFLATQKPDSVSIPTVIRDNAALKLCFRVSTPEQAVTVLGQQSPAAPSPTDIPMSAKGRAVMETEGQGIVLLQAGYKTPEQVDIDLRSARPVEDQAEVAARLSGKASRPASEPKTETPAEDAVEEQPKRRLTPEEVRQEAIRLGLIKDDAAPSPEPESKSEPAPKSKTDSGADDAAPHAHSGGAF